MGKMFLKCKRLLGAFLHVINKEADCTCDRERVRQGVSLRGEYIGTDSQTPMVLYTCTHTTYNMSTHTHKSHIPHTHTQQAVVKSYKALY